MCEKCNNDFLFSARLVNQGRQIEVVTPPHSDDQLVAGFFALFSAMEKNGKVGLVAHALSKIVPANSIVVESDDPEKMTYAIMNELKKRNKLNS